ncbi:hypothetical protein Ac2012v2_002001 [Leucoagaricus gongylophorus]
MATFVAPEGVYSLTDEHSPQTSGTPAPYPTRLSAVLVPSDGSDDNDPPSPTVPEHHSIFSPRPGKKSSARPKHNMRTSSSSFVTRIQSTDGWPKLLQSKHGTAVVVVYNAAKSLVLVDGTSRAKQEPLARVSFSACPTCHDINPVTASGDHLDIIIGFSTGDIVWLDPISSRYARLNKQGCISSSPCTAVRWVPASSALFLVSHADGTIVLYDKERDDGVFTPQHPDGPFDPSLSPLWDPTHTMFVTMPPWHPIPSTTTSGPPVPSKSDKDKVVKNPVSHWRVSRKAISNFVFSPDVKYVAAISEDGCLRIIDALAEQLVDCYASYFGALTCVAWSPDGRFVLAGGQDDLITIFSPWEKRVVARCQGHSSFVSAVAFDDQRCDGRTYRFGSVGEDNKLILWDFSSGALHRPKHQAAHHHRISISSTISPAFRGSYLPPNRLVQEPIHSPRYHPAPSRNEIAIVQPVLVKPIDSDLLMDVAFLPRVVMTATKLGHIKLWVRPLNTMNTKMVATTTGGENKSR